MTASDSTSKRQFGAYKPADVKPFDDSDFDYGSAPAVPVNRADVLRSFGVTSEPGNGQPLTGKAKLVGSEPVKYRRPKAAKATDSAEPDMQPRRVEWSEPPKPVKAFEPTPPPVSESGAVAKPEPKPVAKPAPRQPSRRPEAPAPATPAPAPSTRPGDGYRPSRRPTPEPVAAPPGQPPRKPPTAPPAAAPGPEPRPVRHTPQPVERQPPAYTPPKNPDVETRGGFTFPKTRRVGESDRAAKPRENGTYEHPSLSFPREQQRERRAEHIRNSASPQPHSFRPAPGVEEAHQRISGLENEVSELRSQIQSSKPRVKKGRRRMVAREGRWVDLDV